MTLKRIAIWSTALLLAANCLTGCMAGKYMSSFALTPKVHGIADIERTRHKADSLMPGSTAWYDGLKAEGILKDTTIMGYRGFKVHACYVPAKDPAAAEGTAIVVHGYGDNHLVFLYLVRMYRDELNYNVLSPTCSITAIPRATTSRWAGTTGSTSSTGSGWLTISSATTSWSCTGCRWAVPPS